MSKWIAFTLLALLCPLAPAALACGGPHPPIVTPDAVDIVDYVRKTTFVEVQGKFVAFRCNVAGQTNVGVQVGDRIVLLDLRGNKSFHRILTEANQRIIVAKGELISDVVRVTDLALAPQDTYGMSYKESIKLELRGKLINDPRDILRPHNVHWMMSVAGMEYYLNPRGDKRLMETIARLADRRVIMTGTLEKTGRWNIVNVDDIQSADSREFKIAFARTSGVPDFRPTPEVTFDAATMAADRASELRTLIENSRFFSLKSSQSPPLHIPDPPAGFQLALTMGNTTHRIWVMDHDLTPSLTLLVERMKEMAVEQFAQKLIGMVFDDAKRLATESDYSLRRAAEDGVSFPLTQDYRSNRINVWIEKGKIVSIKVG